MPEPPKFKWSSAAPGLLLVAAGFVVSLFLSLAVFGKKKNALSPLVGLTQRSKPIGAIHTFLVNKLYLDHLYEKVIFRRLRLPDLEGGVLVQPERHRRCRRRGGTLQQAHR